MAEYIDRDAAINGLAKIINESDKPEDWNKGMSAAMLALLRIPAAEVRPVVRGKWIRNTDTRFGPKLNDCIECNCCGVWFSADEMMRRSFCPNCGARMEES